VPRESWLEAYPELLYDVVDPHVVISRRDWQRLDAYEASLPTNPSPGRVWRNGAGQVCWATEAWLYARVALVVD
jgi:hypothetical protein